VPPPPEPSPMKGEGPFTSPSQHYGGGKIWAVLSPLGAGLDEGLAYDSSDSAGSNRVGPSTGVCNAFRAVRTMRSP
jgi:hypothetical protein